MKGETRPVATAVLLTIATCGVYGLVWFYWVTRDIKVYLDRPDVMPALDVLLCLLCYPYVVYWAYRTSRLVREVQAKAGVATVRDKAILMVALALFGLLPVVLAMFQDDLNDAWAVSP